MHTGIFTIIKKRNIFLEILIDYLYSKLFIKHKLHSH